MPERRHMILCTVTDIKDVQVVYPCCSQCCSKLRSDCFNDRWQCLKCGCISTNEELDWRYRLSLMVSDGPYLTNICVFGSVLEQFFGLPSNQFVRFLRKIESMYGNSEDVLMLGLKQCFIGSLYYFGVKATTISSKENIRISLADVVQQKRTACQNSLFSQEEYSNVVAFQMVPAVDRDMNTVYDIIRNFFKDSSDETVDKESVHELCTSNFSSFKQLKLGFDLPEKSVSNHGHSSLSFGQTTALLSCEMSTAEKSDISSSSKRNISSVGSKRSSHSGNNLKTTNFSTSEGLNSNKSLSFLERSLDLNVKKNNQNRECKNKGGNNKHLANAFKHNNIATKTEALRRKDIPYSLRSKGHTLDSETNLNRHSEQIQKKSSDGNLKTKQTELRSNGPQKENETNYQYLSEQETLPVISATHKEILTVSIDSVENFRTDSEPLFSQDRSMSVLNLSKLNKNQQNFHFGKTEITTMNDLANDLADSLEGTLLLQNLNVPELPENIPESEGLDLYLLNNSDFDSEYLDDYNPVTVNKVIDARSQNHSSHYNKSNNASPDHMTDNDKQTIDQSESKEDIKDSHNAEHAEVINKKIQIRSANNIDDEGQGTQGNTSSCEKEFCDSMVVDDLEDIDGIFENSFDNSQISENDTGALTKGDNLDQNECHGYEGTEEKSESITMKDIDEISVRKMINDDSVLSCCPELSEVDGAQLCKEFEKNLCTNIKVEVPHDKSVSKCFEESGELLFESQFTEHVSRSYDTSELNKASKQTTSQCKEFVDCAHVIAESQEPCLKIERKDSNKYSYCESESQNHVSDSIYNASKDLFGEPSIAHSFSENEEIPRFEILDLDEAQPYVKSSKKCVKFSRRLSHHKSVQLIDLQMKMNQNPAKSNVEVTNLKKSCLKQALDKVIGDPCKTGNISTKVLTAVKNSPILDNNFTPLSQDLFSPSPILCFKRQKSVDSNLKEHLENIFEQTEEYEKSKSENSRCSSTPIETDADIDCHEDYTGKSILSVFAESFNEELENEVDNNLQQKSLHSDAKDRNISSRSLSLFSQSCSLFSCSSSKIFRRGDNQSIASQKGSNSLIYQSCDLFSPSGCESIGSPQGDNINMPVKRLFSDKM